MDVFAAFTPEGLAPSAAAILIAVSFFTAALTAAFGLGGGIALLAVMSAVLPAAAVIPVHGVAQLGANASRAILQARYINWPILAWFGAGALVGAVIGGRLAVALPAALLQAIIAGFVLYTQWGPKLKSLAGGPRLYTGMGLVSTVLTMFVGATGPFIAAMLSGTSLNRMQLSGTHAAAMVLQHGLKALAFGALGFAFAPWAGLIAAILVSGFVGTAAGARALKRMPEAAFRRSFRFILTALAVYLLAGATLSTL